MYSRFIALLNSLYLFCNERSLRNSTYDLNKIQNLIQISGLAITSAIALLKIYIVSPGSDYDVSVGVTNF